MDSEGIATIVRRKLDAGDYHTTTFRASGWPLGRRDCDVCEGAVRSDQLLMECISTATNQELQFHVECFCLWDQHDLFILVPYAVKAWGPPGKLAPSPHALRARRSKTSRMTGATTSGEKGFWRNRAPSCS